MGDKWLAGERPPKQLDNHMLRGNVFAERVSNNHGDSFSPGLLIPALPLQHPGGIQRIPHRETFHPLRPGRCCSQLKRTCRRRCLRGLCWSGRQNVRKRRFSVSSLGLKICRLWGLKGKTKKKLLTLWNEQPSQVSHSWNEQKSSRPAGIRFESLQERMKLSAAANEDDLTFTLAKCQRVRLRLSGQHTSHSADL